MSSVTCQSVARLRCGMLTLDEQSARAECCDVADCAGAAGDCGETTCAIGRLDHDGKRSVAGAIAALLDVYHGATGLVALYVVAGLGGFTANGRGQRYGECGQDGKHGVITPNQ